ncbi:hypothetical protein R1flu_019894 [Riccia fluitans]|uniref:dual-specificity kinase n=1 Tax=Riccia fluitans TaxID=41844 RepID=A0ABD1ZJX9_9MARC
MGRKSAVETRCFDIANFMQNDSSRVTKTLARKGLQVKSAASKVSSFRVEGSLRKTDYKHDLPILNLAKVRRNLLEQPELAGANENGNGSAGRELELETKSVGTGHQNLFARYSTNTSDVKERRTSGALSVSDKILTNGWYAHLEGGEAGKSRGGELKNDIITILANRNPYSRERPTKRSPTGIQTSLSTHLPTSRRHRSENLSTEGSIISSCRVVNAQQEDRTNDSQVVRTTSSIFERAASEIAKQDPATWETKKSYQLNSGTTSRDSNVTVPLVTAKSSVQRKVATSHGCRGARVQSSGLDRSQPEDRTRYRLRKTVRQLLADHSNLELCRRWEDAANVEMTEMSTSAKDEIGNGQVPRSKARAPRLNLSGCDTSVPIGFGGNPVEGIQTCRATRTAAKVGSPRLALTERGALRRSSLASPSRKHDKDVVMLPASMLAAPATADMVLRQRGNYLTEYEQTEILKYSEIYYLGLNVNKIQATILQGTCNHGFDDERGDYNVVEHDHLAYRYEVLGILGKGSFGEVLKCMDHKHKAMRAVKMIRNKRRFHHQALVEVKILESLRQKARAESSNFNIVMIYESFYFRGHLCIVFALHDISLYELIKRNNFQGVSLIVIKSFASQLLATLRFLRKLQVIHCDLKPENILLQHPAMSKIKVIDFGSSCFSNEKIYTYIQSRFYRSPEVILGLSYDMMIDIWSLGCILAELYTGYPLFPGENEVEQLACMMEILGIPPTSVVEHASRKKMFFATARATIPNEIFLLKPILQSRKPDTPHRSFKQSKQNSPATMKTHLSKLASYNPAAKIFQGVDFASLLPSIGEERGQEKKKAI